MRDNNTRKQQESKVAAYTAILLMILTLAACFVCRWLLRPGDAGSSNGGRQSNLKHKRLRLGANSLLSLSFNPPLVREGKQ
jgi:ABC-type Fe3+ transport system permease subunit